MGCLLLALGLGLIGLSVFAGTAGLATGFVIEGGAAGLTLGLAGVAVGVVAVLLMLLDPKRARRAAPVQRAATDGWATKRLKARAARRKAEREAGAEAAEPED